MTTLIRRPMKALLPTTSLGVCLMLGTLSLSAQAQNTDKAAQLHARTNAAVCANCHGTEGRAVEGSGLASLAGLPKDYTVGQMKAFKDGSRPATLMHQITKGLSDAQIDAIASYYAALPR